MDVHKPNDFWRFLEIDFGGFEEFKFKLRKFRFYKKKIEKEINGIKKKDQNKEKEGRKSKKKGEKQRWWANSLSSPYHQWPILSIHLYYQEPPSLYKKKKKIQLTLNILGLIVVGLSIIER